MEKDKFMSKDRLLQNNYVCVKKCRHGLMMYNINDIFIGRSLDLYGEWCEPEMEILKQVIRPGDIILDIGASIGTHTIFFSKNVPQGLVYAFEPQRLSFQMLCANIAMNALANVMSFQQAVSDEPGRVKIPAIRPDIEYNRGSLYIPDQDDGEDTPVIKIDQLGLQGCSLIKIDVEGMEIKVLTGAQRTIRTFHPILFVENSNAEKSSEVINIFSKFHPESNMICFHKSVGVNMSGLIECDGIDDNWKKAIDRMMSERKPITT